jgi:SOS-response transcriptional repressor LexA
MKFIYFNAKDNAMSGDSIHKGDTVKIESVDAILANEIALVYAGNEPKLRRVQRLGSKYILLASNAAIAATSHDQVIILGRVIERIIHF